MLCLARGGQGQLHAVSELLRRSHSLCDGICQFANGGLILPDESPCRVTEAEIVDGGRCKAIVRGCDGRGTTFTSFSYEGRISERLDDLGH